MIQAKTISTRFIIGSLLSLAVLSAVMFGAVVANAATPNITVGENMTIGTTDF